MRDLTAPSYVSYPDGAGASAGAQRAIASYPSISRGLRVPGPT